jgi:hypothetical protein
MKMMGSNIISIRLPREQEADLVTTAYIRLCDSAFGL